VLTSIGSWFGRAGANVSESPDFQTLETYGQGKFAHTPQPLSRVELEKFRHDCKVTGFWVGHTDSETLDGLRRLLSTIDDLSARVTMYESALIDKFGPHILDRFGEPPNGWLRSLHGSR
jgi:hypothetical protein